METVGFAALRIIPTTQGLTSQLSAQVRTPLAKAGTDAGKAAGAGYKKSFLGGLKGIAGPVAGLIGVAAGVKVFGDMIDEAREAGRVSRQTAQLIKTTGGAANLTAEQVAALSGRLSDYAAVDDELIQQSTNVILTFKNVRDEVGKGNDIFDRATKAALDLSSVLGTDMQSSALQIGKALNDPIKGVTSLTRAGVQFTEQQKNQIAALVENNDLLGAQKIVLGELEGQVGGAAGASKDSIDELGVAFKNLEEDIGTLVLPAIENLADFASDDLIPALRTAGGIAGDTAEAFSALPGPVKAAATAFGALAIAGKLGVFTALTSGAGRASGAIDTLRIRTMLAADAFRNARTYSVDFSNGFARINPSLSRTQSLMAATSAATVGLGTSLSRGLGGVVGALGGPWGIAIAGGITALSVFAGKHQQAAADAEALKATLDQETGAITKNTRAWVAKKLSDDHVLESAKKLGISLSLVTDAALDQGDSVEQLNSIINPTVGGLEALRKEAAANGVSAAEFNDAYNDLNNVIGSVEIKDAVRDIQLQNEATKKTATSTDTARVSIDQYAFSMKQLKEQLFGDQKAADAARHAHDRLADALANSIRGNITYKQAVHDALKEARDGNRTLDINTEAGRKNKAALLDVSDAWNELSDKSKAIPGHYREVRNEFEKVARALGASRREADKLADKLLDIKPVDIPVRFHVSGTSKARQMGVALPGFAQGGYVGGQGIGDKQLILADSREFIVRPDSAAYWGPEFLKAINSKRMPRQFAAGGPVGPSSKSSSGGVTVTVGEVRAHNYSDFMQQIQRRARASASSEMPIAGMPS